MTANGSSTKVAEPAESGLHAPLPGARTAVILLLGINLFNYIDRQVLAAVEPNIRAELLKGVPDEIARAQTGSLATAFLVTYMVIAPLFGWLGDRFSRWWLIAIGVVCWSLASGASGIPWPVPIAYAFTCLWITRCFVGVGEAAYGPVAPTIISDLYPVKVRGGVLAWFYSAIPVGSALGYALGGIVVNALHLEWRWAFYLVVPPGILLGCLGLFMRDPPRGQADAGPGPADGEPAPAASTGALPPRGQAGGHPVPADGVPAPAASTGHLSTYLKDLKTLVRTPSYVLDTLGMTAMTFAMGALGFWMPAYLKVREASGITWYEESSQTRRELLDPVTTFGGITVLAGFAATIIGGKCGDWLRSRLPGSYFLVSGAAMILGFFMVIAVLWTPFPWTWLMIFFAVFCLFFNTGPSNTILANVTAPAIRSSAFAVNIFVLHLLGDAVSPSLVGWISGRAASWKETPPTWLSPRAVEFLTEHSGWNAGFFVVSLMTLVGGVFWLFGARYLERDTRLATSRLEANQPASESA